MACWICCKFGIRRFGSVDPDMYEIQYSFRSYIRFQLAQLKIGRVRM